MSDAYRSAPDDRLLSDEPPGSLVTVEPAYRVVCRLCGPLDGGLHETAEGAEQDRAAHHQSHAEGLYDLHLV